ncbi:MAG: hypothetical protein KH339_09295 [Firmicutes bacterium]|nr:hypothetical protein [Bacillota bacterium]
MAERAPIGYVVVACFLSFACYNLVPGSGMAADVGYIDMTNINSPSFSYLGRFIVKLGSFEETEYRFGKLLSAVSQLVDGDRGTIDVSPEGAQTVFSPF